MILMLHRRRFMAGKADKIPDILNSFGYDQPDDPAASLTYHEREIIYAYRNRPELQHAVDILLGCD